MLSNPLLEKKDSNWYIYILPIVLSARKPSQRSLKVEKRYKIFKLRLRNILSVF